MYSVKYDDGRQVYKVLKNGKQIGVVAQTIIEIRLGIRLSDAEVIAIFKGK